MIEQPFLLHEACSIVISALVWTGALLLRVLLVE